VSAEQNAARSYYGRPIIKAPIWEPAVPWYFFSGGLAGASASLALGARLAGNARLARNATFAGMAGAGVSPILLTADLGRPERFYLMFRLVKITSPLSVGTWILSGSEAALGIASGCEALGILPRVKLAAQTVGGLLGLPLTTYTAALVANTAVPIWHEARRELPFVFAGSAAASAGAAAAMTTPPEEAGPARRMAVAGALLELIASRAMLKRLGQLVGEPYRQGAAGRFAKLSTRCTAGGAALVALTGRKRFGSLVGGGLLFAGSLFQRFAVYRAGSQSARDPKYTVLPQRERVARTGTKATTPPPGH
jgi:Polysulphide reductase, NrfD